MNGWIHTLGWDSKSCLLTKILGIPILLFAIISHFTSIMDEWMDVIIQLDDDK